MAWRFGQIDHDGPWPWHALLDDKHRDVLRKLGNYEQLTWHEFEGRGGNKRIPVENLDGSAQRRLRACRLDDLDDVWELRLSGAERVWGIRLDNVLYLLWWDPNHEVSPSHLRHT